MCISSTTMELSVDVHSADVFLFPNRKMSQPSLYSPASASTSTSASFLSRLSSSSNSTRSSIYSEASPAYSEVEPALSSDSSCVKPTNSDYAILYAYVDIRFPSATGPSRVKNRLKSLTLTLKGHESISFPAGGIEASTTFFDEKAIDEVLDIDHFEPGKSYRFERAFFVPHTAAPLQRSRWGLNQHKVVAKATFHGLLSRSISASKRVYFIDCQDNDNESDENTMIVWDRNVSFEAGAVGPVSLRNRSEVFTVGGYLRTRLALLGDLPEGVTVVGLRGYIVSQATLRSRRLRKGYTETTPPVKASFLKLDRAQVDELFRSDKEKNSHQPGDEDLGPYPSFEIVSRLPDDNKIRSSTVENNDAAIRITNKIEYELDYIDGSTTKEQDDDEFIYVDGQKLKRFRIAFPVHLNSCNCRPSSLQLPSYARENPMPAKCIEENRVELLALHDKHCDPTVFPCMCELPLESLLKIEEDSWAAWDASCGTLMDVDEPRRPSKA